MNEKFENELYNIDPVFFEHAIACKDGKEDQMITCMYFGCECGDGWFEPLKKFVKKTAIINELAKVHNVKFVCDQLKEKWSEITIYYGCRLIDENKPVDNQEYIDVLSNMLDEAYKTCEKDCWNVCEWCGADGGRDGENLITTHGWISRICKKCAKSKVEYETKHSDEINKEEYTPRITWFQEGYEFLNPYHVDSFEYNNTYYNSIIEAFYCEKDSEHKKLYQQIVKDNQNNKANTMEIVANEAYHIYIEEPDYDLLKEIVKAKFTYQYNENIKNELLETTGKVLQNTVRNHNNIWGYCICEDCKDKEHKDLYSKILTEIREEISK